MEFLVSNLSTIVVSAMLIALVAVIVRKMRRDKKNGRSSCGCSCRNCPSAGLCHHKESKTG